MSLSAVGIVAQDLPKSVAFYGLLGVPLKQAGGPEHFEGATGTGTKIMIDSIDLMKKLQPTVNFDSLAVANRPSPVVLCFEQSSPAKVDELFTALVAEGAGGVAMKEPWDAFWGQRYSSVRDPDGNQIDIYAALPAAPAASDEKQ